MKRQLLILIVVIFFNSCKKTTIDDWYTIEIKAQKDINCGIPDISFVTGINEAKKLLNSNSDIYVALNLPKVNYQVGEHLSVKIKKPDPGIACLTLGTSFPQVEITDLK